MKIRKTEINSYKDRFSNVIFLMPTIRIERHHDGDGKCYAVYVDIMWLRRRIQIEFDNGYFPF